MRKPFLSSFLFLLFAIVLSLAIGAVFISPAEMWKILTRRWRRKICFHHLEHPSAAHGADCPHRRSLSGSGAAYQGLFRNPLADPFLIGVASGAGLGSHCHVYSVAVYILGVDGNSCGFFYFCPAYRLIVYFLARVGQTVPTTNLILASLSPLSLLH